MELLKILPSEMMDVMEDCEEFKCDGLISSCCPRKPQGKAGNEERRRKFQILIKVIIKFCSTNQLFKQ